MPNSYRNVDGTELATSASPTSWFGSEQTGKSLTGTSGADALYGTGFGATLTGLSGDDTYYVYDIRDVVKESANGGIDTIVLQADGYQIGYALPDNVENMIVDAENGRGTGNAAANIIQGTDGTQWLNGGAGNDVLIGGSGKDVFVFEAGANKDLIADFDPNSDVISVGGNLQGFKSFADVSAAMTQVGTNVVIDFGQGNTLTLANVQAGTLDADNFLFPQDKTSLVQTFADEFSSFNVSSTGMVDDQAVWRSTYWWGRTIPTNSEAEFYGDQTTARNPFSLTPDGVLNITAEPFEGLAGDLTYNSGVITTQTSHAQTYGYFEIKADLPEGAGFWPAFWLLPANGDWPPEIDVFEVLGQDTDTLHVNAHSDASGSHTVDPSVIPTLDLADGFNTFAVSWRPDFIIWYLNGTEVARVETPDDMHRPMYMLANLAVGDQGSWPGVADGVSTGVMSIDYIRAYQFADLSGPLDPGNTTMVLNERSSVLLGGDGSDRLIGGAGSDDITSGKGNDIFVVRSGGGNDVVHDFVVGQDKLLLLDIRAESVSITTNSTGTVVNYGTGIVTLEGVSGFTVNNISFGSSLKGTTGNDVLDFATRSNALEILAFDGNDKVQGGSGDDWIVGGSGNDTLSGGAGADSFVFQAWSGDDVVTDFRPGVDRIVLVGVQPESVQVNFSSINGVSGLEINFAGATPGTTVDHTSPTDSIFLAGVTTLAAGDIAFAFETPVVFDDASGTGRLAVDVGSDGFVDRSEVQSVAFSVDDVSDDADATVTFKDEDGDVVTVDAAAGASTVDLSPLEGEVTGYLDVVGADGAVDRVEGPTFTVEEELPGANISGTRANDVISDTRTVSNQSLATTRNDTINGFAGNDQIYAVGGNDILNGGAGNDTVNGGAGNDIIQVRGAEAQADLMNGAAGFDTLELLANSTLNGFSASMAIEAIDGNNFSITGTTAANTFDLSFLTTGPGLSFLDGGSGNDTITGSDFADTLRGGAGNDRIKGGEGNDTIDGGSGNDTFIFGQDCGDDRLLSFGDRSGNQDIIDLTAFDLDVTAAGFSTWLGKNVVDLGNDIRINIDYDVDGVLDATITLVGLAVTTGLDFADFAY